MKPFRATALLLCTVIVSILLAKILRNDTESDGVAARGAEPVAGDLPAATGREDAASALSAAGSPDAASPSQPPLSQPVSPPALSSGNLTLDLVTQEARAASARRLQQAMEADRRTGEALARQAGLPVGQHEWVSGYWKDGRPMVTGLDNASAAISTGVTAARARTDYQGLTGAGMVIGEWDGGKLRTTHQEYASRLVIKQTDAFTEENNFHSTHVAGILAGAGIEPLAKGMAPSASLWYWDGANDLAEMTEAAANFGTEAFDGTRLTLSNHSYGLYTGWHYNDEEKRYYYYGPAGTTEDPAFGYYGEYSRLIDALCIAAPYYLPVMSAGNQRNHGPSSGSDVWIPGIGKTTYDPGTHPDADFQNGGYDTMGPDKMFKNGLAVGAVDDAVSAGARHPASGTPASFSSYGPADDGRVKPDLVGNGVALLSALETSDTGTVSRSGTSMSSPNVCGSALLLQQYSKELFSRMMLNYELKALILHTCDDLGRPGPDYQYGWGLMNTEAALDRLRFKKLNPAVPVVETSFLANGWRPSWSRQFQGDGGPVRITLCWTDPAAATLPQGVLNVRTPSLVNDLDLRLENAAGTVLNLPWRLDPAAPQSNATRGDNVVDNVEQIVTGNLPPGIYTVRVTHKGTLAANQSFAVVISGQSGTVGDTPFLHATTSDVELDVVRGTRGPAGTVNVKNPGAGTLHYSVTSDVPWIQPSAASGTCTTETDAITINLETQNLGTGTFTGTLTVASTNPPGLPPRIMKIKVRTLDPQTLDQALSSNGLSWTAGGTADPIKGGWWYEVTARTGRIAAGQTATLQTSTTGPGIFSFTRSSGGTGHTLEVLVNGVVRHTETGPQEKGVVDVSITASGPQTILLRYTRGSSPPDFADGLIVHRPTEFYRRPDLPSTWPVVYGEGGEVVLEIPFTGYAQTIANAPFNKSIDVWSYPGPASDSSARINWSGIPVGTHTVTLTATGYGGTVDVMTFTLIMAPDTDFSGPDNAKVYSRYEAAIPWTTVGSPSHDGVDSAQSGTITHSQSTTCYAVVTKPATVSFWCKTSSEAGYDKLNVYIGKSTTPALTVSGEQDWSQRSVFVPWEEFTGSTEVVRFSYEKDSSASHGQDRAWIDQVVFTSAPYMRDFVSGFGDQEDWAVGQTGKPLAYYMYPSGGAITSITADQLPPGMAPVLSRRSIEGTPASPVTDMVSNITLTGPGGSFTWQVKWNISAAMSLDAGLQESGLRPVTPASGGWYAVPFKWADYAPAGSWPRVSRNSFAVRPPVLGEGERSELELELTGPCVLQLARLGSSDNTDVLTLSLDGVPVSGNTITSSTAGTKHLLLRYQKDSDGRRAGQDTAWVTVNVYSPMALLAGPSPVQAFQGQFFRHTFSYTAPGGYAGIHPSNSKSPFWPLPPDITWFRDQAGTAAEEAGMTGTPVTPGTTNTTVTIGTAIDGVKIPYNVPLPVVVNPTVTLPTALDWGATLLYPVTTGGDRPWFGQTVEKNDGVDAARAGSPAHAGESWLQLAVPGDALFRWRWKASCEPQWDKLALLLDGTEIASISGEVPWQTRTMRIPSGSHSVRFVYSKDGSISRGQDTAWVDTPEYVLAPSMTGFAGFTGTVGTPLTAQTASGFWLAGAAYSFAGFPPGVSMHPVTGVISGTPLSAGTFNGSVTAETEAGAETRPVTFSISQSSTPAAASDFSGAPWSSRRNTASWFGQSVITHDGVDALQSGYIGNAVDTGGTTVPSQTVASIILTGPGTLTFWHKVESEENFDFFRITVNGVTVLRRSGVQSWKRSSLELQPGQNSVQFIYEKDVSISAGRDAAWIDEVTWTPGPVPAPPQITALRRSGSNMLIDFPSRTGFTYTFETSTNLSLWQPVAGVVNGNGNLMTFTHPGGFSPGRRYYRMTQTAP